MIDPLSNQPLPGLHIVAPIYYLRMKHQVTFVKVNKTMNVGHQ